MQKILQPVAANMLPVGQSPQGPVREIWNPLYDSVRVADGGGGFGAGTEFRLFSNGLGAVADGFTAGKTVADTNLERGGGLPNSKAYKAFYLGFSISVISGTPGESTLQQLGVLLREISVQFESSNYNRNLGPLAFWPGGIGVSGLAAGAGTAASPSIAATNGLPSAEAQKCFGTPIVLQPGENFAMKLRVERTVSGLSGLGLDIQARFDGYQVSSVAP